MAINTIIKGRFYLTFQVDSKIEANSPVLQNLCLSPSQPITVIRGLDKALGIGKNKFEVCCDMIS